MTVFMVDRDLPGITLDALGQAQAKAIETAGKYQHNGRDVRYIRSTFVPGERVTGIEPAFSAWEIDSGSFVTCIDLKKTSSAVLSSSISVAL